MNLGRILNESPAEATPRTGKWTEEEEHYAAALVHQFVAGSLMIPSGTSLRSFLANKLRCSAMRVSTKLSTDMLGDIKIPKRLGQKRFFPTAGIDGSQRQSVMHELSCLRMAFLRAAKLPENDESDDDLTADSGNIAGDEDSEGPLRVGSWSEDEEAYAEALIDAFLNGVVRMTEGATLRAFLAERLSCNPMRVSKKLATGKVGKMVLPKRLGSATYRCTMATHTSTIYQTEFDLEQLRLKCFASVPTDLDSAPPLNQSRVGTPPAQQNEPSNVVLCTPTPSALSLLHTGVKRKLPSLEQASGSHLPSLQSVLRLQKPCQPSDIYFEAAFNPI